MSESIRIRAYNVEFGDAILVTIPDEDSKGKPKTRHLLLDVGNKLGKRGSNKVFIPVVDAIHEATKADGGIDLYVSTHEHLDHVEGLAEYVRATKKKLPFEIRRTWMTASAKPGYYKTHKDAEREKKKKRALYYALRSLAMARGLHESDSRVRALLANNDPDLTDRCVDFLRKLAPAGRTHYVYRGMDVSKLHPFRTAKLSIWGPEEDSSVYYGSKKGRFSALEDLTFDQAKSYESPLPLPLAGVDASAFYDLVERRSLSLMEGLFSIDRAANDTSVVFCLTWKKKKLLFVGDAEQKSWRMMADRKALERVDFLKVGHHGSHNSTPPDDILEKILPKTNGAKKAKAIVSTCKGGYSGVPDSSTIARIKTRASIKSTEEVALGKYVDVTIPAG